jgi:hypothetical protein
MLYELPLPHSLSSVSATGRFYSLEEGQDHVVSKVLFEGGIHQGHAFASPSLI